MYINSFCSISPAGVLTQHSTTDAIKTAGEPKSPCIEPDYTELIPPMQLRRMTKPVRTGVAAAKICLQHAETVLPDAIHAGTAYGMLQDSEQFLQKMISQEEQMLNPTAFIQSTHNTVAGQIALSIGCNAHNMTYVHLGHSFESAALDAALMLEEHEEYQVLCGAVDECTDTSFNILKQFNVYNDQTNAGEGASFFLLSGKQLAESMARITAFDMFVADAYPEVRQRIEEFTRRNNLLIAPGDILLTGPGYGNNSTGIHTALNGDFFAGNKVIDFKKFSGEYPTASSFAIALAVLELKETPDAARCWIIQNHGRYWSLWCLDKK